MAHNDASTLQFMETWQVLGPRENLLGKVGRPNFQGKNRGKMQVFASEKDINIVLVQDFLGKFPTVHLRCS